MPDLPEKAVRRLGDEMVIWLTTVRRSGQPQTSPVWYWWDGEEILVYSLADTARTHNLEANPKVSLNLDGNGRGGDIVTIEGVARLASELPPADRMPEYCAKYEGFIARNGWTPEGFAADYPVPILIRPTRVRAW